MIFYREDFIKNGTYGKCYVARDSNGRKVALKEHYYEHIISGFGNLKELDVLARLSFSTLVPKLLDIIINEERKPRDRSSKMEGIIFVTELADMDGERFFRERNKCTPKISIRLSAELLVAIEFLHSHRITHRDIKPGNMLITFQSDGPHLKLCDFGFAAFLCNGEVSTPEISTAWYRPPEVCWSIPQYGYTSDIWSVGCAIYEMFTGRILLENAGSSNYDLFTAILNRIPVQINNDIINLYRSKGQVTMKFNRTGHTPTSLINHFNILPEYSSLPSSSWRYLDNLLMDIFDLNYRTRKSSTLCLLSPLFTSEFEYISNLKSKNSCVQTLDPVLIIENENVYEKKINIFNQFIRSSRLSNVGMRIVFHALDLTNRYFNKYPETIDVEKIVLGSLYFYNKYFSTLRYPEIPEFFFGFCPNPTNPVEREKFELELDSWIFNFEKQVLEKIAIHYCIYRPGLYEMPDEYNHLLTPSQIMTLFNEFLMVRSWSKTSFRSMYRIFYRKCFDSQAFPN